MGKAKLFRLPVLISAAALALVVGISSAAATGVSPSSVTATVSSGSSIQITKTVSTPAIPPNPDIVFLSDATGSMVATASNVAANATAIMNDVTTGVPTGSVAEFAAADYLDGDPNFCPSDPYAFAVDQGLTTTLSDVQNAINTWPATASSGFGCDTPESQINALDQIANGAIGFRPDSTRVVVWFGDSSGHDPSLTHSLTDAINALVGAHILVIAIPVTTDQGDGLDSTGQATAIANATGGVVMPAATPDQVSAAILAGLSNLPVTVTPSATCDPGLTATYDSASQTVTSGTDATFQETLSVAANAPDGDVLHCTVDFLLNGMKTDGFEETVALTVPFRPADLAIAKTATASAVLGSTITNTLTVTNNGGDPDPNVVATDPLPSGETFVSADPGCTFAAGTVTCDFGTLAAGASAAKSFTTTANVSGPTVLSNTATVAGDRPDPNLADNSSTATTTVYGFAPGGGAFVVGNQSATGAVTFWSAQWSKLNGVSGGAAPAAFKGFALNPSAPACGVNWSTDPGNSAPPPAGPLPSVMAVIVSSSVTKSGSQISGNTTHIVLVSTNSGYGQNPGHAGTGTVIATIC